MEEHARMKYSKPMTIRRKADDTRNYGNFGMGWFGVILGGGLFLCFGVPLTLVVLGWGTDVKTWSLIPIWALFAIGGPALVVYSLRNIQRAKRSRLTVSEDGKHPWDWDHNWKAEQQINEFWKRTIRNSVGGFMVGYIIMAFILPGVANIDKMNGEPMAVYVVGGIFGGFWLLCIGVGLAAIPVDYMLRDLHIRYARIPYFTGSQVQIQVRLPEKIVAQVKTRQAIPLQAQLRLIEEDVVKETRRDVNRRKTTVYSVKFFQCWSQTIDIGNLPLVTDEKGRLVLSWEVPEDLPGNDLTGACVRTWQLSLKMKYGWFPVKHHYLVPIYDRPDRRSAE